MPAAAQTLPTAQHEVVSAFAAIGYPLNKRLEGMLNENIEHQSPRRGCGFTQASRFLAEFINQPRCLAPDQDLRIFAPTAVGRFREMLNIARIKIHREPCGITELRELIELDHTARQSNYIEQLQILETLPTTLQHEESRLIAELILSILGKRITETQATTLTPLATKLAIGTCPEAERYFLEYAGGFVRRQGIINLLYAQQFQPIIVEKINIGDSHSCMTLTPLQLNNVLIPAGSLLGTRYTQVPIDAAPCATLQGAWLPLDTCQGFRFLRLSTLAVSSPNRARAFSQHLKRQLEGSPFFDPLNTSIRDIAKIALTQIPN